MKIQSLNGETNEYRVSTDFQQQNIKRVILDRKDIVALYNATPEQVLHWLDRLVIRLPPQEIPEHDTFK